MADARQQSVSAIVLAGGRGSRMGFADKGLVELEGSRLIEQVIRQIRDDVSELIISCNRNFAEYERYGTAVEDNQPGFTGPLTGILSASAHVSSPICLVVPCDMPSLPENLCHRLSAQLNSHSACVAHDGYRLQPLVMLLRISVAGSIEDYLAAGNSTVRGWLETLDTVTVDFSDQPEAFANVNRPGGT